MELIYRAFDGKEFDDENDCENYERIMLCPKDKMTFNLYDGDGQSMNLLSDDGHIRDDFYYITAHSAEEAATLYDLCHKAGISTPWNDSWHDSRSFCAGNYYYDTDEGEWLDFSELEYTYLELLNIFNPKGK